MAAFKKQYRKRPTTKKAFVKKAVSKAKTQRLTKFIKKVMTRQEEKKTQTSFDIIELGAYTGTNMPAQIIPITPYDVSGPIIAQGTGQGDRIGNKIRTVSCWVRGVIYPNPQGANNPNPMPQEVRVWFFSVKENISQPTSLPYFFQNGNTNSFPVGTLIDLTRMINTESYTYKGHRTYKVGFSNYGATGSQPLQQTFSNNDFKYNIKYNINVTGMIPKVIKFNDTDNNPTTKPVFMFWESVDANGDTQPITETPLQMNYTTTYVYTDV